jgi:hypothetical protein
VSVHRRMNALNRPDLAFSGFRRSKSPGRFSGD